MTTKSATATEKQVRRVIRDYREYADRRENEIVRLVVLFKEDGSWASDVMNGGYSKSDRDRNGDYVFDELDNASKNWVWEYLEIASKRLSTMQLPFGRGLMFPVGVEMSNFIY